MAKKKRRFPDFLTAAQYAAKIGKSRRWVLGMLKEDRIPDAQLLPIGWIIPEDAQMIARHLDMLLPPELIMDIVPREAPEYSERPITTDPKGSLSVELPGYKRAVEDYTQEAVYRMTGVHPVTQRRLLHNLPVKPDVARRLAHGLGVDTDELLRRK